MPYANLCLSSINIRRHCWLVQFICTCQLSLHLDMLCTQDACLLQNNAGEGAGTSPEPHICKDSVSMLHTGLGEHSEKVACHSSIPFPFRYERRYIERWLAQGNLRCPATGQGMTRPISLTRNVTLRKSIEEWAEKNATWMLVSALHILLALAPLSCTAYGNFSKAACCSIIRLKWASAK